MSQSKHAVDSRQNGKTPRARGSATTAEGIAAERALMLAARLRGRESSQVIRASRRLENAARADARAA